MDYCKTLLQSDVHIDGVYSVHYFEYAKDFAYSGEVHDFWELVYADKQSLYITAGTEEILLPIGNLYIHRPNEFHKIRCDGIRPANSVIVSFDCDCPALMGCAGRVIQATKEEKTLLGAIIREAAQAFSTPLGLAYTRQMRKSGAGLFGCEQMVRIALEQLLILLIRDVPRELTIQKREDSTLLPAVTEYLTHHVEEPLRFPEIRARFNVSASTLKKVFREQMGCGVMEYFTRLKVDAAKEMIRSGEGNFTQIAYRLGFNTPQYFCTVFRRVSGMSPKEYAASVRSS